MPYVFLSHSHANKDFARKLAADLRNAGHSVWIDEAEINIGDFLNRQDNERHRSGRFRLRYPLKGFRHEFVGAKGA